MSSHALLAPSDAGRWVNCAGSALLQHQYPENDQSESAREGELAHDLAAMRLGREPRMEHGVIDPEMERYVDDYVFAVHSVYIKSRMRIEEKVVAASIHPEHCWGTCDLWWYDSAADILHIWDFKYGWSIVEAVFNWQLIVYAVAILESVQAGNVHLHVYQPRPYHPEGPHRVWKLTRAEVLERVPVLQVAAASALAPHPPLSTGGHCKHCTALYPCPAAGKSVGYAIDVACQSSVPHTPPEQLGYEVSVLRRASEVISGRLAAAEETALAMIKQGAIIPGWTQTFTAGRETWETGKEEEVRTVAALYGVAVNTPPDLITPNQAIKQGLPEDVVKMYTNRTAGKAKLEPINAEKIKQLLGDTK